MQLHSVQKYANGLGPARWGKWNAFLPFSSRFYLPAITHDFLYATGGTEEDKENADATFLFGCIEASGSNPFALFMAIVYFLCVHFFGHYFFSYNLGNYQLQE